MYWHPRDLTIGAWLAIAYITLFLGSFLSGVVYNAGRPEGIALAYLIALGVAIVILPLFCRPSRRSAE